MGADVKRCFSVLKAWSASLVHMNGLLDFLVSEERGSAIELKFLMNLL